MIVLVLLLLVVVACVGLLLGTGFLRLPGTPAMGAQPERLEPAAEAPAEPVPRTRVELGRRQLGDAAERSGPRPSTEFPRELLSQERFEGTGSLEVHLDVEDSVAPAAWTLALEPSRVLIGGANARARTVELGAGERMVQLEDVPLGGYAISARAPGLNGPVEHVLLAKPTETMLVVRVRLAPSGFIQGRVVDVEGRGVGGLEVVLEPLPGGMSSHGVRPLSAVTDPGGAYVLEGVLDGEYRLFAGPRDLPLSAVRELEFQAPSLHMPELRVPVLGEIAMQVLDSAGRAVAGAQVLGWGQEAGRFELETDAAGRALARFLPPGRYTLVAAPPEGAAGMSAVRAKAELAAGQRAELELRLRP